MPKYQKRPVIIEAMEFRLDNFMAVLTWLYDSSATYSYTISRLDYAETCIEIETLEGTMKASLGDYLIKGIRGEFYPCKPDIFAETYEEVSV